MELIGTDAKVWWLVQSDEIRPARGLFIRDAVARLVQEFEFVGVPTGLPPPNEGLIFREGRVLADGRQIVIGELVVYNDGVTVKVPSSTDDADIVLEKALAIGRELGLRMPITPPVHFYQSFMVVQFSRSIDGLIQGFDKLSYMIQQSMHLTTPTHLATLMFAADPQALPRRIASINPTAFRLERKIDFPYDENRYFSMANTTTGTHIAMLEEIERSL